QRRDDGQQARFDERDEAVPSVVVVRRVLPMLGGLFADLGRRQPFTHDASLASPVARQRNRAARFFSTSTRPRPNASTRPQRPGISRSSMRPMPLANAGSTTR